ncbi:MAG: metalloregulator ArsR/SmtB family transcription factor [Hyphomonas sp.]|nr:metalloregulator ArsR/SmtB family transcription factor [Hyphomonas sp.]
MPHRPAPRDGHPKRQMFGHMAALAKALSHGDRIEVIDHLVQGERTVDALARIMQLPVANVSQHLQSLHRAGVVRRRTAGRSVVYGLGEPDAVELYLALRRTALSLSPSARETYQRLYADRDPLPPVPVSDLARLLDDKTTTILDVRPAAEYRAGHIPGALSTPADELAGRISLVPDQRPVVAYCRGPNCIYALNALDILRPAGFDARRLDGGFMAWKQADMTIEI